MPTLRSFLKFVRRGTRRSFSEATACSIAEAEGFLSFVFETEILDVVATYSCSFGMCSKLR